jgi:adenylate cyclase
MRPGIIKSLLWVAPLLALIAVLALRIFAAPEFMAALQQPLFEVLKPLSAEPLTRPAYADRLEEVFLALAGLGIVFLIARARIIWAGLALAAAIAAAGVFAWQMAAANAEYFDAVYPAFALMLVFLAGAMVPAITGGGERTRLKRSMDTHLAPAAMAAITRQPELLNLNGETRTMSYLICGIRRYPALAEAFADEPEGLRRVTRRTLTALSQTVLRYHGAVDRITPGGLAAFFNAPLEDPEHAVHACECALAMTRAMEAVNHALEQQRRSDGSPYAPVEIGIGIHSGTGVVGDFGAETKPEYTVAGRAVQLAHEVEQGGAKYGPAVIVTDAVRKLAERNFAFLEVDTVVTPNAAEPVKLYALLGNPLLRASPKFRALATFHDHIFQSYRAREWSKAKALIEQCRTLSGASPQLYDLYMQRIAWFEANPPGENWNGAVRAPII